MSRGLFGQIHDVDVNVIIILSPIFNCIMTTGGFGEVHDVGRQCPRAYGSS